MSDSAAHQTLRRALDEVIYAKQRAIGTLLQGVDMASLPPLAHLQIEQIAMFNDDIGEFIRAILDCKVEAIRQEIRDHQRAADKNVIPLRSR